MSHYFYKWYGERWGIETGFRIKANDLRAKTTSRNYKLRLFYFLFSTMLYNLWVLTNIIVSISLYDKIHEEPIITVKRFANFLFKVKQDYVDPGG